jgi:hypothetical protein
MLNQTKSNIYIKKGTMQENELDLIYTLTKNKLNSNYIDKMAHLLYDCKSTKNYPLKRINLDKAVYKFNKNNELYLTLPNFYYKNRSITYDSKINNKNSSIINYTENGSNFLSIDSNYNNNSNYQITENNQTKLNMDDIYGNRDEEKLNRSIKRLLLNEELEIPKLTKKLLFNQLKSKYNFIKDKKDEEGEDKKIFSPQLKLNIRYENKSINKEQNLIFPKLSDNKFVDYLKILKQKTFELDSLKHKKFKKYSSPIFFLGKNKAKHLSYFQYISFRNLNHDKSKDNNKNDNKENQNYLKIMGKDIKKLCKINEENKNIFSS